MAKERDHRFYIASAFLGGGLIGFFALPALCGDCDPIGKVGLGGGFLVIALTAGGAQRAGSRLTPDLEKSLEDKPPAWDGGFREGYHRKVSSKYTAQIVGGSILGLFAGFAALGYVIGLGD
jgi:hypothetical protein